METAYEPDDLDRHIEERNDDAAFREALAAAQERYREALDALAEL